MTKKIGLLIILFLVLVTPGCTNNSRTTNTAPHILTYYGRSNYWTANVIIKPDKKFTNLIEVTLKYRKPVNKHIDVYWECVGDYGSIHQNEFISKSSNILPTAVTSNSSSYDKDSVFKIKVIWDNKTDNFECKYK